MPSPSKITSPSPAALIVMGFSGVPFSVSDIDAVEGRHHRVDVVQPLGFVEAGVDQDRVARLSPALPDDAPVAEAGAVVGLQEAGEAGLDFRRP